jgi:hypothetical protein
MAFHETDQLSEEIIDLLAEALFKDFQEHRGATVKSPQGSNHKNLLTMSPEQE